MRIPIFFACFFLFITNGHAKPAVSVRDLFLSLPDSVFTRYSCFHEVDSFPVSERKRILNLYDSAVHEFNSENIPRLIIVEYSDSLERMVLDNFADTRITLQLIENGKKGIFFSISSSSCDFVTCDQDWDFYLQKKKKISTVKDVLPVYYPMSLFFDTTYLRQMGVDPALNIHGTQIYFEEKSLDITLSINTDFFDKELFGEDHPMVKLDPGKMIRNEIHLRRKGFVYEMRL